MFYNGNQELMVLAFSTDIYRKGLFAGFYYFDDRKPARIPMLAKTQNGLKYSNKWHYLGVSVEGEVGFEETQLEVLIPSFHKAFGEQMPVDFEAFCFLDENRVLILSNKYFEELKISVGIKINLSTELQIETVNYEMTATVRMKHSLIE